MNATDKAEALRLLDEMHTAASMMDECGDKYHAMPTIAAWRDCWKHYKQHAGPLRSLLSAQGEAEPSAEHWKAAARVCYGTDGAFHLEKVACGISQEQRARELARLGVGNG